MNKYEVLGVIGEGAYGVVLKCRNKETQEIVAIKKFKETEEDETVRKNIQREVKMLRLLKDQRNIVELKEAFKRKGRIYLVFEYVERNLLEVLESQPDGLDPEFICRIIYELLLAIQHCHQNGVVHRDVKPENLLVKNDGTLKLCDFGFARPIQLQQNQPLTDYVATRWYRSPELILAQPYSFGVDLWAISCIMGELIDGQPLFPGENELDQLYLIQQTLGKLSQHQMEYFNKNPLFQGMKFPEIKNIESLEKRYLGKVTKKSINFMKSLLKLDQQQRLDVEQALQHTYFDDIKQEYEQKLQKDREKQMPLKQKQQQGQEKNYSQQQNSNQKISSKQNLGTQSRLQTQGSELEIGKDNKENLPKSTNNHIYNESQGSKHSIQEQPVQNSPPQNNFNFKPLHRQNQNSNQQSQSSNKHQISLKPSSKQNTQSNTTPTNQKQNGHNQEQNVQQFDHNQRLVKNKIYNYHPNAQQLKLGNQYQTQQNSSNTTPSHYNYLHQLNQGKNNYYSNHNNLTEQRGKSQIDNYQHIQNQQQYKMGKKNNSLNKIHKTFYQSFNSNNNNYQGYNSHKRSHKPEHFLNVKGENKSYHGGSVLPQIKKQQQLLKNGSESIQFGSTSGAFNAVSYQTPNNQYAQQQRGLTHNNFGNSQNQSQQPDNQVIKDFNIHKIKNLNVIYNQNTYNYNAQSNKNNKVGVNINQQMIVGNKIGHQIGKTKRKY